MKLPQKMDLPENTSLYSFDHLVSEFKSLISCLPDKRKGLNKSYSISDAALAAFSVFFMQSPSFLAHQANMQELRGKNNAQSLFQIENIPSDNQIRNLLDPIAPSYISPMFDYVFNGLKSINYFEHYRAINDNILIALDGVNYFSSHKIHCDSCNTQHHTNGTISYTHNAITPVIVAPNNPRVISLTPEFMAPQDGHDKQDSENAAAKRWLKEHGYKYRDLNVTILGDALYSHQPTCEAIINEGFHFILTCKPDSHKKLYDYLHQLDLANEVQELRVERIQGKRLKKKCIDIYRFVNNLPIRDSEDTIRVNWCQLETVEENGKRTFINSYITDHRINADNVSDIIKSGRTRWKTENENNNTLKNHGYHMEHNFGHGTQHLSQLLLTFNLLAFLFHTALSIMDKRYQELREKLPTRKSFFDSLRTVTMFVFYTSWDNMLQWMLDGLEKRHCAESMRLNTS